mmetsp:Transcript_17962/g.36203  ORF Transcript_17962/g.36203 Transcript_17962/m.36203 type:complete len:989 (+) Transcript_17962:82-3048(+)
MKFPFMPIAAAAACCLILSTDAFVPSTSNNAAFRSPSTKTSSSSLQAQIFSVSSNHVAIGDTIVENPNKGKKNGEEANGAISTASLASNISSKNEEVETIQSVINSSINGAVKIKSETSSDGPSDAMKEINGIKMSTDGKVATSPKKKERSTPEPKKSASTDAARTTKTATTASGASFTDRIANSGAASAAAMATAAVNAAVAMKSLDAPDVSKSYISLDKTDNALDEEGLPLVYDKDLIEQYWRKERGALNKRWSYFVGKAVPFLTKLVGLFIADGKIEERHIPGLSEQARIDLQDLGPTFIKLGQMMSVRPDVLPQATLDELSELQDSVVPFDTTVAVQQIESELGGPLGQFFTSISEEPVAAASLAQVYLATLNDGKNTKVAVKVQRPDVLSTVSKDLYVLRRAAEVFQGLVERFAPQQRTNYVALLNEWAIGFYTELDFENEARNQITLRNMLRDKKIKHVTVPAVYEDLCTRRILVSEWMDGKKLSDCSDEDIGEITPMAQEAFLTQLFEVGFFHADPHPGNILKLNEPTEEGYTVALIDCGLMARIDQDDRDNMISAVIHLANKDYASLVDDFISLKILPADSDRAAIIPLMDKALSPYVKGGGAKKYEEELKKLYNMEDGDMQSQVGGFQAMTQDALTVLNDIPFSIPPYFAILGRAIVTLEGIALTGDPNYGIIMESYPFIARKLLREDRPEIQSALQEVLYSGSGGGALKMTRLLALLNNAAGAISTKEGAAFVDLDAVPEDGIEFADGLKFLMSDNAESLRTLLEGEVDSIVDIVSRQILRKGLSEAIVALTPPRPPSLPFIGSVLPQPPQLDEMPLPLLLPGRGGSAPSVAVLTLKEFIDLLAPKLDRDEEIYAISLGEAAGEFFGQDAADFVMGDGVLSAKSGQMVLGAVRSGVFGQQSELLSGALAQQVLSAVSSLLNNIGGEGRSGNLESTLDESMSKLSDSERARLDSIVQELTQRSIERATRRLEDVSRIIG